MEEILSIRKQTFRSWVQNSSFGIGLIGQEGKILFYNEKFKEFLNLDIENISGLKDLAKRIAPEVVSKNEAFLNWLVSFESPSSPELRYEHFTLKNNNGTKKYLKLLIIPLENKENLIIVEDVTKRMKMEELMKRLENHLYHSKKLETIGLLTEGIIHDFSDLLTVILGNAEIGLMRLSRSNPVYEILSRIKEAAQDGSEWIKRLSEFVKLLKMKSRRFNLNDMLHCISKIPIKLVGENIELKIKMVEDLKPIYGDPGIIIQILVTIISHAHLIIPLGGIVSIETRNRELKEDFCIHYPFIVPGDYVQISIIYSGKELNKDGVNYFLGKTLEHRSDESSLSIIYQLVKRSNGYIMFSTELENELLVYMFFPAYQDSSALKLKDPVKGKAPLREKTILLAEDEEELRKILSHFLSEMGYNVLEASNGGETIQVFLNHPKEIDLIILDLIMPKMNGIDVFKNIRVFNSDIPFIIITGHREELIERDFDKYTVLIKKPFDLKELMNKVQQILDPIPFIKSS